MVACVWEYSLSEFGNAVSVRKWQRLCVTDHINTVGLNCQPHLIWKLVVICSHGKSNISSWTTPAHKNELSEVPLPAKHNRCEDTNEKEGVLSGQVNVLHPWAAIPKSKHVQKEARVYFTYCHHPFLIFFFFCLKFSLIWSIFPYFLLSHIFCILCPVLISSLLYLCWLLTL